MADDTKAPEPRGFGEHTRGLSSEYAHEQGWGLNEEERKTQPEPAEPDAGNDFNYGAQDFGDEAVNTSSAKPTSNDVQAILGEK